MTESSSAHQARRTRSSDGTMGLAHSPSRNSPFGAGCRTCPRSSSLGVGSIASRQVCEDCAGSPNWRPEQVLTGMDLRRVDDMPTGPPSTDQWKTLGFGLRPFGARELDWPPLIGYL